ncbi:hypothetical protein BDQ17DRAFT_1373128 [Cyathus striatus]|nr:hypothetical protein BDQ17DRAFT_1373128 [Cyathus striatus]
MQFKFAFTLLAAATSAFAAPAAIEISNREAIVDDYLYVCIDANWGGACENVPFTNNQCTSIPGPYFDLISSWGLKRDGGAPPFDSGCTGASLSGQYPGFGSIPVALNDAISSFICFRE